jgi:hypothetical protein
MCAARPAAAALTLVVLSMSAAPRGLSHLQVS